MAHVLVRPVNAGIPHRQPPPWNRRAGTLLQAVGPYLLVLEARPSNDHWCGGALPEKRDLSQSVEPGGGSRLSLIGPDAASLSWLRPCVERACK
jgi:hypothetical protein